MPTPTLEHFIRKISRTIEKLWNIQNHSIQPMFHLVKADGKEEVVGTPLFSEQGYKDALAAFMEKLFTEKQVVRFVMIAEAWMMEPEDHPGITADEFEKIRHEGLSNHPKRAEAIVYTGEDADAGFVQGWQRIVRPTDGRVPYLESLKFMDMKTTGHIESRWAGLLRKPGQTTQ